MQSTEAVALAQRFLELLQGMQLDSWAALLADDVAMHFPYSPPGFPTRHIGRVECEAAIRGLLSAVESFEFFDVEMLPGQDPGFVTVTARSRARTRTGRPYGNEYVMLFKVRNGKIHHYREYFNPAPIIAAFGGEAV